MGVQEFNKILFRAIDEEMKRILGETGTQTIYFYLEHNEHLEAEDIPNNLEKFLFTLERIFNMGALVIEKAIMENLYRHLSLKNKRPKVKFQNEEQFNFINYINALKSFGCINALKCTTKKKTEGLRESKEGVLEESVLTRVPRIQFEAYVNPKPFVSVMMTHYNMANKKATIVITLVEESKEIPNEEIEKEIREELKDLPIPWCKKVEKVTVTEEP